MTPNRPFLDPETTMPAAKKTSTTTAPKRTPASRTQPKGAKPTGAAAPARAPKVLSVAPEAPAKKLSALAAAARVLEQTGAALTPKELIGRMAAQGLWASPNGKTPDATLSAALQREIATKGAASRFRRTAPGRFAAATTGATDNNPAKAPKAKASGTTTKATKAARAPKPAAPAAPPVPDGAPGPESLSELFRI